MMTPAAEKKKLSVGHTGKKGLDRICLHLPNALPLCTTYAGMESLEAASAAVSAAVKAVKIIDSPVRVDHPEVIVASAPRPSLEKAHAK